MRPDDPLAEKEFIKKEDLIGKPLILPERVSIQSEIANWFGKDFSKLQIAFTSKLDGQKIPKRIANIRLTDDVLFGENWNNQDIDIKTRSMITVVALMASGITDSSLKYHLQNAKDHGVTQKEIVAVITHVAFYAGWPKAWAVFNLAKEARHDFFYR